MKSESSISFQGNEICLITIHSFPVLPVLFQSPLPFGGQAPNLLAAFHLYKVPLALVFQCSQWPTQFALAFFLFRFADVPFASGLLCLPFHSIFFCSAYLFLDESGKLVNRLCLPFSCLSTPFSLERKKSGKKFIPELLAEKNSAFLKFDFETEFSPDAVNFGQFSTFMRIILFPALEIEIQLRS